MTLKELKQYFEDYATRSKDFQHTEANKSFYVFNNDKSVDEIIRLQKKDLLLCLITPEQGLYPPQGENYSWDKIIFLFVIKRVARGNHDQIWDAQSDCEEICNDIFAQLHVDRYDKFDGFNEKSWLMQPVGPMSDSFYGFVCNFNLVDNFNPFPDPARRL